MIFLRQDKTACDGAHLAGCECDLVKDSQLKLYDNGYRIYLRNSSDSLIRGFNNSTAWKERNNNGYAVPKEDFETFPKPSVDSYVNNLKTRPGNVEFREFAIGI